VDGEIALKSPKRAAAKAHFEGALTVARKQQAKSWELRAAMSMARLWRDQGKRQQAYELLAPVARRIASAARIARSASFSCATGYPNNAIKPSPSFLATLPPTPQLPLKRHRDKRRPDRAILRHRAVPQGWSSPPDHRTSP
jgi:hypothetical protein